MALVQHGIVRIPCVSFTFSLHQNIVVHSFTTWPRPRLLLPTMGLYADVVYPENETKTNHIRYNKMMNDIKSD